MIAENKRRLALTLDAKTYNQLDKIAKSLGMSKSGIAQMWLAMDIEEYFMRLYKASENTKV